jgi:uncharacterized protein (DUF2141 family)
LTDARKLRATIAVAFACFAGACGGPKPGAPPGAAPVAGGAAESSIVLSIAPVRVEAGGVLLVALFADEAAWLKEPLVRQSVPADLDTVRVVFDRVPAGRYAIAVIHDENGNGELDTRILPFPKPTEGLAVSNNTWGFGRPAWTPATFELGAEPVELQLELRYF